MTWINGKDVLLVGGEAPQWHVLSRWARPFEALCGRQLPPPDRLHLAAFVPGVSASRPTCVRCIAFTLHAGDRVGGSEAHAPLAGGHV